MYGLICMPNMGHEMLLLFESLIVALSCIKLAIDHKHVLLEVEKYMLSHFANTRSYY